MAIEKELLDRLLAGNKKPEDLIGKQSYSNKRTKTLLKRALAA